jgi:Mg2+ and Co2+ transporter CorA
MIVMRALGPKPPPTSPPRIRIQTWPAVFFILPRCLVTIRPPDNPLVPQVRERILAANRYNQRLPALPEELMLRLLSGLVDRYLALRHPLTAQLETWQRNLLNPRRPFKDWTTLLEARMELRKLQHLSEEQLDAIQEWRDERLEHADPGTGVTARDAVHQRRAQRPGDGSGRAHPAGAPPRTRAGVVDRLGRSAPLFRNRFSDLRRSCAS